MSDSTPGPEPEVTEADVHVPRLSDAAEAVADEPREPEEPGEPRETEEAREALAEPADPAAPAPLGVPRTATGNADVDAGLDRLGDADHLATDGHIEVYEDVHRGLREALTALDARPGPPAPSGAPTSYDNRS
ncbi:hypothetical protein AB0I84_25120 [Streptomyces spectabilis]|uniref:hypothetical protein n=1 Tax=Streptomyces spectabilis TaxID=68270 RepID=UPI00340905BF